MLCNRNQIRWFQFLPFQLDGKVPIFKSKTLARKYIWKHYKNMTTRIVDYTNYKETD
jgi:hypothetical protein